MATGLIVRDGRVLLVASRYPNLAAPLWGLPGGRQREGELLSETVAREMLEETNLRIRVDALAYASESFDRSTATHVTNATFLVSSDDSAIAAVADAHVVSLEWVPIEDVGARIAVAVVRDPLVAYLRGDARRYFGFPDAGISIAFSDDP